jgi:hypothetical protein
MSIVDFITARIAEDEARARDLKDWRAAEATVDDWIAAHFAEDGEFDVKHEAKTFTSLLAHVGYPDRVLAECEAKRRIVEALSADPLHENFSDDAGYEGWDLARERLLPLLALPYADHPDYQQEWKP